MIPSMQVTTSGLSSAQLHVGGLGAHIADPSTVFSAFFQHGTEPRDSPDPLAIITVNVQMASQGSFSVDLQANSTVLQFKRHIEQTLKVRPQDQTLVFNGQTLKDEDSLTVYGVSEGDQIYLFSTGDGSFFMIPADRFDPIGDRDYTQGGPGPKGKRGGEKFTPPWGWRRYGLKVKGVYENDDWLATTNKKGEWIVSYHGTSMKSANSIAQGGYDLSKGTRFLYGRGVYSASLVDVAEDYCQTYEWEGRKFKVAFMNRVNPAPDKLKRIPSINYFVSISDRDIRPYGLLVKEILPPPVPLSIVDNGVKAAVTFQPSSCRTVGDFKRLHAPPGFDGAPMINGDLYPNDADPLGDLLPNSVVRWIPRLVLNMSTPTGRTSIKVLSCEPVSVLRSHASDFLLESDVFYCRLVRLTEHESFEFQQVATGADILTVRKLDYAISVGTKTITVWCMSEDSCEKLKMEAIIASNLTLREGYVLTLDGEELTADRKVKTLPIAPTLCLRLPASPAAPPFSPAVPQPPSSHSRKPSAPSSPLKPPNPTALILSHLNVQSIPTNLTTSQLQAGGFQSKHIVDPAALFSVFFQHGRDADYQPPDPHSIITLRVKVVSRGDVVIDLKAGSSVLELKQRIHKVIKEAPEHQTLMFCGQPLKNEDSLIASRLSEGDQLHLLCTGSFFMIPQDRFDPIGDRDYTQGGPGSKGKRGGEDCVPPWGWYRYGLKVTGRFENDIWLGKTNQKGEWIVSYHGTSMKGASGIVQEGGYDLGKGKHFVYGRGVYSAPLIEIAEGYCQTYEWEGRKFKVAFMNRVNPAQNKLKRIPGPNYFVSSSDDDIRPYGLLIKEIVPFVAFTLIGENGAKRTEKLRLDPLSTVGELKRLYAPRGFKGLSFINDTQRDDAEKLVQYMSDGNSVVRFAPRLKLSLLTPTDPIRVKINSCDRVSALYDFAPTHISKADRLYYGETLLNAKQTLEYYKIPTGAEIRVVQDLAIQVSFRTQTQRISCTSEDTCRQLNIAAVKAFKCTGRSYELILQNDKLPDDLKVASLPQNARLILRLPPVSLVIVELDGSRSPISFDPDSITTVGEFKQKYTPRFRGPMTINDVVYPEDGMRLPNMAPGSVICWVASLTLDIEALSDRARVTVFTTDKISVLRTLKKGLFTEADILYCSNLQLDERKTFGFYSIKTNAVIKVIRQMTFSVSLGTRSVNVNCSSEDACEKVKLAAVKAFKCTGRSYELMLQNDMLPDDLKVASLPQNARLILRLPPVSLVIVELDGSRTPISFDPDSITTVGEFKQKYAPRRFRGPMKINEDVYPEDGMRLPDMAPGSFICWVASLTLDIEALSDRARVTVFTTDQISVLRTQKPELFTEADMLYCSSSQLDERQTFGFYSIPTNAVIKVIRQMKFKVYFDTRSVNVCCSSDDACEKLKTDAIVAFRQDHRNAFELKAGGQVLDDGRKVSTLRSSDLLILDQPQRQRPQPQAGKVQMTAVISVVQKIIPTVRIIPTTSLDTLKQRGFQDKNILNPVAFYTLFLQYCRVGNERVSRSDQITLNVDAFSWGKFHLPVRADETARQIKSRIEAKIHIPSLEQTLLFCGKVLVDSDTPFSCAMANGDKIRLVCSGGTSYFLVPEDRFDSAGDNDYREVASKTNYEVESDISFRADGSGSD